VAALRITYWSAIRFVQYFFRGLHRTALSE
jgi:hypothetical protein